MQFPATSLALHFKPYGPDFMDTIMRILATRMAMEKAEENKTPTVVRMWRSPAFWTGVVQGFGAIGFLFSKAAAPKSVRQPAPSRTLDSDLLGMDMRCAMVMLVDARKLKLPLTAAETMDMNACLAFEQDGRHIYQEIRAMGLAALKPRTDLAARPV